MAPVLQARPLRALLGALLKMDLRNQAYGKAIGAKPNELLPPVYWVLGQFLATSMLLSLMLFARVEVWFFAFANLSATAVLLFSALVVEFHEVVLDPADAEVLAHRPVSRPTYAAARLLNLLAYVAFMTAANAVFPLVLGSALRDGSWAFAAAYVPAVAITAAGVTAVVVLLYLVLGARSMLDRARPLLAWVQIASILVIFYGAQAMLRVADGGVEYLAARPPPWLERLPTASLARAVEAAVQGRWSDAGGVLGLGVAGAAVLCGLAGVVLGLSWRSVGELQKMGSGPVSRGAAEKWGLTPFSTRRVEHAVRWLVRAMLKRDGELKMKSFPALATPAAAVALGWATGQLADPSAVQGESIVLALAAPVVLAGAVPSLFQNVLFSRSADAGLMLSVAPIARGAEVGRGARKAVLMTLVAPAVFVLLLALAVAWREPVHAAVHAAIAWLLVEHAARLAQVMVLTHLPFSRAPVRGGAFGGAIGVSAIASAGAMGVAAAQYALAGSLYGQLGVAAALLVLLVPASRWADGASDRVLSAGGRR